jgi:hypothetical protein
MTRARSIPGVNACAFCGAPAPFGFGPPLRRDQIWTCGAHSDRGAPAESQFAALPTPKAPAKPRRTGLPLGPDLFGGR